MPTFLQMAEILSCSMAGFLPYILLVIYPFRNHMRLKGYLAGFLTLIMTAALLRYDLSASLGTAPAALPIPLVQGAALMVLALLSIRAPLFRILLNTLSVVNLSVLISAAASWNNDPYTLNWLLATLGLQALLLIPYALNLVWCLAPTLNCSDAPVWKLLWIAPAAGSAIAALLLLTGAASKTLTIAMIAATALAAAACAVILTKTRTEMITLLLKKEKPVKKAPAAVTVAAPVAHDPIGSRYRDLLTRMAESEHSCKEMLLQVMSMEDDLDHQDYDRLRQRLNILRAQLSPDINPTGSQLIDQVITYYTRQALLSSVKLAANVTLPELTSVTDEDMAVLLGCLIDNALDACREQSSGTRRIAVATYQDDDLLQIGIKNTYTEPMDTNNERLNICRGIAARYDGKLVVIDRDGATQVVVTLTV